MTVLAPVVVRRFLASVVLSDDRFRPPQEVIDAVEFGELPVEALNVWKAVVDKQTEGARPLNYGSAFAYWRNKCAKNGIDLPAALQNIVPSATQGSWKIKSGDEIEEWVKETLRSKGLLDEVTKTAHDWEMEIAHLQRMIKETNERIAGALRGSGKGSKTPLAKSQAEFDRYTKELETATGELARLQQQTARYETSQSYAVEFEKEFQFMMLLAAKDLDKTSILASVRRALQRFEEGLEIPNAEGPAYDVSRYENKAAGLLDELGAVMKKAWDWVTTSVTTLLDWFQDLGEDNDKIESLLDKAGA